MRGVFAGLRILAYVGLRIFLYVGPAKGSEGVEELEDLNQRRSRVVFSVTPNWGGSGHSDVASD